MTDAEKWAAYDIAKNRLSILVGHYSELVFKEQQKAAPDLAQIEQWENEQEAIIDQEAALSVEDQATIEKINSTYGPAVQAIMQKG
ncbi:hypothetical protein SAMN03159475_0101 [Pseudomonas sp. NFPP33]|nr:hypothetical protein [Pseudomonas sp. NFPP33]SDA85271.1 hypothetical protein SAMN03159475_0101 [Pseudomonas sp. NFPP33]